MEELAQIVIQNNYTIKNNGYTYLEFWKLYLHPNLIEQTIHQKAKELNLFLQQYDLLCGIACSGIPIVTILHNMFHKPFIISENSEEYGRIIKDNIPLNSNIKILVVDSIVNRGATFTNFEIWNDKNYQVNSDYFSIVFNDTMNKKNYTPAFKKINKDNRYFYFYRLSDLLN
ncbi:phosphoribosyltransferase [Chloroflexota bacterium]|nr:phosphoribosyltransferase [Chloroflexota bacterium]